MLLRPYRENGEEHKRYILITSPNTWNLKNLMFDLVKSEIMLALEYKIFHFLNQDFAELNAAFRYCQVQVKKAAIPNLNFQKKRLVKIFMK